MKELVMNKKMKECVWSGFAAGQHCIPTSCITILLSVIWVDTVVFVW